jgi:hypothetical protein
MKKIKILVAKLARFLNGEHLEFIREVIALVNKFGAGMLNIEQVFEVLRAAFAREEEAIAPVRKSKYTELITKADSVRDKTFIGLKNLVKAAMNHIDPAVAEAAKNLWIVFQSFGNINKVGKENETAHVAKLVSDLQGTYAADVATVGATRFVEQLKAENDAVIELTEARYEEQNTRTDLKMKDVRPETDSAYSALTERITALLVLGPESAYLPFIEELNNHIRHYDILVKERLAHNAAVRKDLSDADISSVHDQPYAGGAHITPLIEVFYKGTKLVETKDYTVEYADNTEPGTASVTVKGKGKYTGRKVTTFNIVRVES